MNELIEMFSTLKLPTVEQSKALTAAEKRRDDVLRINEIFYSIQGESSWAGERCIFVRLTGCGLRCSYCDTEYAFYEGTDMPLADVLREIEAFDCKLIELTGGEPLEQEGAYTLIGELLDRGFLVMVETGGHMDISRVDRRVKRVVDLKTPSSKMEHRNELENIGELTTHDEVKFVIGSLEDYLWSREMVLEHNLHQRAGVVLFSPVFGSVEPRELVEWILEDNLPVRFQVQLHKIVWPASMRGV